MSAVHAEGHVDAMELSSEHSSDVCFSNWLISQNIVSLLSTWMWSPEDEQKSEQSQSKIWNKLQVQ